MGNLNKDNGKSKLKKRENSLRVNSGHFLLKMRPGKIFNMTVCLLA